MGEFFIGVIMTLFALLVFLFGQSTANQEIKVECLRQGSFYVGNATFECKLKETVK